MSLLAYSPRFETRDVPGRVWKVSKEESMILARASAGSGARCAESRCASLIRLRLGRDRHSRPPWCSRVREISTRKKSFGGFGLAARSLSNANADDTSADDDNPMRKWLAKRSSSNRGKGDDGTRDSFREGNGGTRDSFRAGNDDTGDLFREGDDDTADSFRDECGVVGIYGDQEASGLCYLSLHALQHRGQEGAGIAASDGSRLRCVTGMGLVSEVFKKSTLSNLNGASAVGHVRYATAGESALKNVQPFVAEYRFGSVGVAHNGNLVNYNELRAVLEENGSIFNTSSDTEVVLHLIAMSKARPFIARLVDACNQLEGAYSMVFLTEDKLVAARDPYGFRPLVMGRRKNGAVVIASETCALDLIECTYEREILPGEVVVVDKEGISSLCLMPKRERKACVFEHIYFALPSSIVFGLSVYQSRYRIGETLALESPVDCDVVIAVPDSGVVAALGYAAKAKKPFQQGLIRSHYMGRTFIEPSQKIRDFGVKLKLAPVKAVLAGKRVVVVDDSIVRGTTSSKIVRLIKDAGATEVHLRIASPPITGSCYYGVDTPSKEELISHRLNVEETRAFLGADSLAFLPIERLSGMMGADASHFCYACFGGDYPVPPKTLSKDAVEKEAAHRAMIEKRASESWFIDSGGNGLAATSRSDESGSSDVVHKDAVEKEAAHRAMIEKQASDSWSNDSGENGNAAPSPPERAVESGNSDVVHKDAVEGEAHGAMMEKQDSESWSVDSGENGVAAPSRLERVAKSGSSEVVH